MLEVKTPLCVRLECRAKRQVLISLIYLNVVVNEQNINMRIMAKSNEHYR